MLVVHRFLFELKQQLVNTSIHIAGKVNRLQSVVSTLTFQEVQYFESFDQFS